MYSLSSLIHCVVEARWPAGMLLHTLRLSLAEDLISQHEQRDAWVGLTVASTVSYNIVEDVVKKPDDHHFETRWIVALYRVPP